VKARRTKKEDHMAKYLLMLTLLIRMGSVPAFDDCQDNPFCDPGPIEPCNPEYCPGQ
jgi:hypothetical protein